MKLKRLTSLFVLVFAIMSIFAISTIGASAASTPTAPKNLTYDVDGASVTLSWSSVSGVDGYKIAVKNDSGNWETYTWTSKTSITFDVDSATTYTFSVRSYDKSSGTTVHSSYSSSVTLTSGIGQVTNLKSSDLEFKSVTLSWSAVEGATGYQIYGMKTSSSTSYSWYGSTTSTSYVVENLTGNNNYKLKVRAYFRAADGTVSFGEFADVIIEIKTTLSQTEDLEVEIVSGTTVNLSWDAVPWATGYQIWVKEAGDSSYSRLTSTTSTSIKVTLDETTQVKVRAYYRLVSGSIVYGAYSDANVVVGMVSNFKVTTSSTTATFTWDAVDGADGYKIAYLNDSGKWVTLTYTSKTTAKVSVSSLKTYTVSIRAYEKSTTSSTVHSDYSSSMTFISNLGQVTSLKSSDLEFKSVTLSWAKVDGATGYQIYGMKTNSTSSYSWYGSTTSLSYVVSNLTGNNEYKFKVRAYYRAADGTVTYGEYADAIITITTTLSQVDNVDITSTSDSTATISWDTVQAAAGYQVYIKEKGSTSYSYYGSTTSTSMKNVEFDTAAEVKVRAYYRLVSGSVLYGAYSDVEVYVGTVSDFKVSVGASTVTFSWSKVDGASGYKISYLNSSGNWTTLSWTSGTSLTLDLGTYKSYTVSIRAYEKTLTSSTMHSDYSNSISFTTAPAAASGLKTTDVQLETAKISWSSVTGATGYDIYLAANGSSSYKNWVSTSSTSCTIDIVANSTNKVKIKAYYELSDGTKVYGDFSSAIEVNSSLATVTNLKATDSSNANEGAAKTVSWSAVAGATGYEVHVKADGSSSYEYYTSTTNTSISDYFSSFQNSTISIKVRAYYTSGDTTTYGSFSSAVTGEMGINTVKNFTVTSYDNYNINLSWTASGNCTGYIISYKAADDIVWLKRTIVSLSGSTTSCTFEKLTLGTTYEFEIVAYFNTEADIKAEDYYPNSNSIVGEAASYQTVTTTAVTTDVNLSETEVKIYVGESYEVVADLTPSGLCDTYTVVGQDYEYEYSVYDGYIITVTRTTTFDFDDYFYISDGVIYATQATIIPPVGDDGDDDVDNEYDIGNSFSFEVLVVADDSGATSVITLTIGDNPLEMTTTESTWYEGMTTTLTVKSSDIDYTVNKLIWTSSNTDIAEISDDGVVKFISTGYVSITATTEDGRFSVTLGKYVYA